MPVGSNLDERSLEERLAREQRFDSVAPPDDPQAQALEQRLRGKRLPLVDEAVFSLEKETIPYWSKFLQGYYDSSGISSDSFDQAVKFSAGGDPQRAQEFHGHGVSPQPVRLPMAVRIRPSERW